MQERKLIVLEAPEEFCAFAKKHGWTNLDGMGNGFSGPTERSRCNMHHQIPQVPSVPASFVQWVNASLTVFSKSTGAAVYGPVKRQYPVYRFWRSL
ncbi:hypothetical protein EJG51_004240 [Undibacterium piscinae]|uniref:Uncharacterized protein n=1 Tax=Undibacterium piscinae TaxID=2495591 RepID=A0A6M3ZZD1_9BURK|nr:hypothetical protein EJG51_004240 [Undibacterium piscinae]